MASVQADLDTLRSLYNTLKGNTESCANIRTSTDSSLASTPGATPPPPPAAGGGPPNHNTPVIANGEDDEHLAPVQPSA